MIFQVTSLFDKRLDEVWYIRQYSTWTVQC